MGQLLELLQIIKINTPRLKIMMLIKWLGILSNPNDIDNALSSDNLVSLSPRSGGNRLIG